MGKPADQLQGTLDLLVLRTLASTGEPLHGYAITERIHQVSEDVLRVEEGSLYPALHRMDEAGWVRSEWGVSENNRRARYYAITRAGERHLSKLEERWAKHVAAVRRVLRLV
jgi:PadR family transcriptional regulator